MKFQTIIFLVFILTWLLPGITLSQTSDFSDISQQSGFNATGFNHGVAIGDFNQDGFDDIYISRADGPNLLYINHGNFQFEEAAAAYGVDYAGNTNVSLWVDIDQDHDLDLFLGNNFENNVLYRNDGDHFTDVSAEYGIQTSGNTRSLNAVDYDNDGDLDIYVAQVLEQNIFWRNDGDHFTNIIASAGIDIQGRSLGAVFFDYDNDGDQDLYQGQDGYDQNFLYRNNGDGTFTDVSESAGVNFAGFCMGATVGDVNHDGIPDIYVENLDSNKLYISNSIGSYREIATNAGVADIGMGWGAFFFDYNNNALLDIYLCNDSYFGIPGHGKVRNRLFINQGNLNFASEDVTATIQNEFGSYGGAYADFDLDGKLDLAVANESPVDGDQLFRNISNAGNYISFQLEGTTSNYQAIGSRVVLYDQQNMQTQYVIAGSGYAAENSLTVQFGLGDLTSIDSVVIYWPSGLRQKSGRLPVNKRYHVTEGKSILATGAVVWTVPPFPTQHDDITVFFDASAGNAALEGYQGDVYAHTGVISNVSANDHDWKHVIGNWGTADARVLMTREEENIYSLSYNITDFYGIPQGEDVRKLAFVFRNVNGSVVGRNADGSDIFTDVAPNSALSISLRKPEGRDIIVFEGDSLLIDLVVNDTADLQIFDNDNLIFSDTVDQAMFYHHPTGLGPHVLKLVAATDTTVELERNFLVIKKQTDRINPPDGVVNGLNYRTDSTYLFQLYAPLKQYVFLLCPQNHFQPDTAYQLHLGEDESTWWIELPRTRFAGGGTAYQYLINGDLRVADPLSEVVLDPGNDGGIYPDVMATLPPYPQGMTTGIVTAFDSVYQPFDFKAVDYQRPDKAKLVIYELLVRDFLADHRYTSLMDTLDYFQRLGVNAIELMPVSEFEGNNSWGYNQSFHMAVDKYYGTREQLKEFIDAAHERGIAVILDVVFNHTFNQDPIAQMYWDNANGRPSPDNPYLNVFPKHPFNVGNDVNHESPATKSWVKEILSYWINEFRVDGFRFDLSKGFTQFNSGNDVALMGHYDASRIAILEDYADHVWSQDSTAYVILEHFADNDEETVLSNYGMLLWGNINYDFSQAAKGFNSTLRWLDYTVHGWNDPHVVGYMESHDEERTMYRVLNEGASQGDYNTRLLPTALRRMAAVNALFYSVPGPKMLWEFGDLGYDYSINTCVNGSISNNCRLDPKPIRWDYLQQADRFQLNTIVSDLIHLRNTYPTFTTDNFLFNDGNQYVKTVQLNHPDMDALTLVNFRVINSDVIPKFQYPGTWYEYFTGDSIVVTDTEKRITFGPGEYRIYTSKRIVPPHGFYTATKESRLQEVQLFPTLVISDAFIYGQLDSNDPISSIMLTDMTGRSYTTNFTPDGDGGFSLMIPESLPAGMFVVSVRTVQGNYIGKVIKQ